MYSVCLINMSVIFIIEFLNRHECKLLNVLLKEKDSFVFKRVVSDTIVVVLETL